jgi:ribose 5-phosphate isomerase RpiB
LRIAVINEVSASARNRDILLALDGYGHEIFNLGMTGQTDQPELTYIHTGLMSAMLIHLDAADLVIGGCGTGQGYLNSVMQYPDMFCGLITTPLDAWLFSQINAGNCLSLPLNLGYGWAADINLRYVFEKLFSDAAGKGYPESRSISQMESRQKLKKLSGVTHRDFISIVQQIDDGIIGTVFQSKAFVSHIKEQSRDTELLNKIIQRSEEVK